MSRFGDYLKHERERKGFSLRQLGKELNLSAIFLSELERGTRRPSLLSLMAIAEFFGLNLFHCMHMCKDDENDERREESRQAYRILLEAMARVHREQAG